MVWRTIKGRKVNIGDNNNPKNETKHTGKTYSEVAGNTFNKKVVADIKKNDEEFKDKLVNQVNTDVRQLERQD